LDSVEFRGEWCKDQWFPIAIYWITDAVEQRNNDEKELPVEYGSGKIIDRVDYQISIHVIEIDLQAKSAHSAQENQEHTEPSASTHGPFAKPWAMGLRLTPKLWCLECGSERESPIAGPNEPI